MAGMFIFFMSCLVNFNKFCRVAAGANQYEIILLIVCEDKINGAIPTLHGRTRPYVCQCYIWFWHQFICCSLHHKTGYQYDEHVTCHYKRCGFEETFL